MLLRSVWREACHKILIWDLVFVLLYVEDEILKKRAKNIVCCYKIKTRA